MSCFRLASDWPQSCSGTGYRGGCEADMKLSGGCFCGAVRYEISGKLDDVTHCHCIHCRRTSGAAFVTWAEVTKTDYRVEHGTPRTFESRPGVVRSFCGDCGSPLTFYNPRWPESIDVIVCR